MKEHLDKKLGSNSTDNSNGKVHTNIKNNIIVNNCNEISDNKGSYWKK